MRKLPLSTLLLALLVAAGVYACDQASPVEPDRNVADQQQGSLLAAQVQSGNPFTGSWMMTSAVVGDDELLAGTGLRYIMTFRHDLSHSVSVSDDAEGLVCGDETSCGWDGEYRYTGTTITTVEPNHPDPGEQGEDSSAYVFCGGRLISMDSDGEVGIRLTFKRTGQER